MSKPKPEEILTLALPVIAGALSLYSGVFSVDYTIWSDRDLLRAYNLFEEFQVTGAEINGTYYARVPGGMYYYILAVLISISPNPLVINAFLMVFIAAGTWLVYLTGKSAWSVRAGLISAGIYALSPILLSSSGQIWNPAVSPLFTVASYYFLWRFLAGSPSALPWLFATLAISAQLHLSNVLLLFPMLFATASMPGKSQARHWWGGAAIFVAIYSPYLVLESANGWVNTGLIWQGHDIPLYAILDLRVLYDFILALIGNSSSGEWMNAINAVATFILAAIGVRIALALKQAWPGFDPRYWRENLSHAVPNRQFALTLSGVVIIGCALLVVGRVGGSLARYYVFIVPAFAFLFGAFADTAFECLQRWTGSRRWPASVLALVLAALVTAHTWPSMGDRLATGRFIPDFENHAGFYTQLRELNETFDVSKDDLKTRVIVINDEGKPAWKWSSYLIELLKTSVQPSVNSDCFALVAAETPKAAEKKLLWYFQSISVSGRSVNSSPGNERFQFVRYSLPGRQCFTTIANGYDIPTIEKTANAACAASPADGVVGRSRERDGYLFIVRHSEYTTRLCLTVGVSIDGRSLETRLNSAHWRGYIGFPINIYEMAETSLVFENQAGRAVNVDHLDLPLGSLYPVASPQLQKSLRLPPGAYKLTLRVLMKPSRYHDVGIRNDHRPIKVEYVLTDDLRVSNSGF